MSVSGPILRRLLLHPRRVCCIDDQRSWKGIEMLVGAFHLADAVSRLTDRPRIGIMLPTSGLFPMAALGTWIAGRTVVPLNYLLKKEDLQYVIDDAGLDLILTVQPMIDFIGFEPEHARLLRLESVNFKRIPELRWPAHLRDDDLAVILYTSGTSGRPKGVMLSHGNLSANIRQCCQWANFTSRDVGIGVLPQFHVFGMTVLTFLTLTVGALPVFSARFVPRKVLELIRTHRPTVMVGIPTMYNALLTLKDAVPEDLASLRYIISGGEPLPDSVAERFRERFGKSINEGFGMTETSAVSHWCRPHEHRPHSVGRAVPEMEIRIVGPDGKDQPPGQEGELRLRGPNIMKGYFHLPEETAKVFDEQGYLRTGDMARVDDDGFLYITGRIKEMMIIGGENVFPREIEEVLNRHPSVHESGVIGVRDPSRGEVPVAFVELKEDAEFDETALRSFCRQHLAQYKVPREIHHLEKLPRNPTGKILRRELKSMIPAGA